MRLILLMNSSPPLLLLIYLVILTSRHPHLSSHTSHPALDCTYTEALRNTVSLPMTPPSASAPESFLEISIYDHDFGENDDFIGYCKVMWSELSDLKPGATKPLMKELLSLKGLSVGDIYFDIQVDRGTVKVTVNTYHFR